MDTLIPLDRLAENWARNRIECHRDEKYPALNAATGVCLAALQPGIDPALRIQWMSQAAHLCPHLGWEVAHLAWAMPESDIRLAFRAAWPSIDPNQPQPGAPEYVASLPFGARTPPIMMALAYGNIQGIEDALGWYGQAPDQMANSRTQNYHASIANMAQPASWLAWALAFRQWELAERLFALPSMRAQDSLDRALLEVVGTLNNPRDNHVLNGDIARGCRWIHTLVDAGANVHRQHQATTSSNPYQWFIGKLHGLDIPAIERDGWMVREKDNHCAYTDYANRKCEPGQPCLSPSPAQWLMGQAGPIGWRRPPRSKPLGPDDLMVDQVIEDSLSKDLPALSVLWNDASSRQWADVLEAIVTSHAASAFRSGGWASNPWCPTLLLHGFGLVDAKYTFSPQSNPDKPHCLWLDAIALQLKFKNDRALALAMKFKNRVSDELNGFYISAVEQMAANLHENTDAFIRGMARAMAFPGQDCRSSLSSIGGYARIDDYLDMPGIAGLLASLPEAFRQSFSVFAARDRELHEAWVETWRDPDQSSGTGSGEQIQAAKMAAQPLLLHRGSLYALGHLPPPARAIPRM